MTTTNFDSADFKTTLFVSRTPNDVFHAISKVQLWWSEDFKGRSQAVNDEFGVRFGDVHYSRQKIEEMVPGEKIVWLVTESQLSFLSNKAEWTGTKVIFELEASDNKTHIHFTHQGLVPRIECYKDCTNGWTQYLEKSLVPFINSGKGNPNVLNREIGEKAGMEKGH